MFEYESNGTLGKYTIKTILVLMCIGMTGCYAVPPAIQEQQAGQQRARDLWYKRDAIDSLLAKDQFREAQQQAKDYGRRESMFGRSQLDLASEGVQLLDAGPATADKVLERMNVREDKVDNIRWYHAKANELRYLQEGNGLRAKVKVYAGQKLNQPANAWLLLNITWHNSRWAFMQGMTVTADSKRFDWPNLTFKRETQNTGIGRTSRVEVEESIDMGISDKERQMLHAVIHAKDATMRLRGKRFDYDYTFTDMDRLLFQDMLTLYDKLKVSR